MSQNKEEILKSILSMRRRLTHIKLDINREIDIFEEQMNKSLKRIDKISYLSKKFSIAELTETHKAYEKLVNPGQAQTQEQTKE
ncbi:MAG: hypothetical protein K0S71_1104 [Clostridia bacterium]|jgi:hypothetical protein|nr:hypothetical protein [Clostridia bacterium]